jgi:hypothetical protein
MSKSKITLAAAGLLALAALPSYAADNKTEIATAASHAGMAASASAPQMVKTHLQHVLNCLEGPKGADFVAAMGNPCGSQGEGAIPDAAQDGKKKLEDIASLAKQAQSEQDIDKAKKMASEIQADLGK